MSFIIYIIVLLIAITIHEFAHAKTADYLGDPTPRLAGRLTLNPIKHIDLFGLVFLFIFGFGWGKPVPFDYFNLKNPKKDAALISLAGPGANFILAIISALILKLFIFFKLSLLIIIGKIFFIPLISLSIILGVFNLIPIHPLDGFKIVEGLLSERQAENWRQLARYGSLFLLILILPLGSISMLDLIIKPIVSFIMQILI